MSRVAIVGVGHTVYSDPGSLKEPYWKLDFEAASAALDDAGMTKGDIDAVITASYDLYDGIVISAQFSAGAACSWWKDGTNLAEDGAFAIPSAYMKIRSGMYDTVMVVSHGTIHSHDVIMKSSNIACDPFFFRPIASNNLVLNALQASRYKDIYGISEEYAARISVMEHGNAMKNPHAHIKTEVSIAEVLNSPVLCWPIRALEYCPASSGASAIILATEELASWRATSKKIAYVKGIGWASETYQIGNNGSLDKIASTVKAANMAYEMAGIKNPTEEIDVAEIAGVTPYQELMLLEALGFCDFGKAISLVEEGVTAIDGKLPVNPSGGLICTNPVGGAGLFSVAEAAMQVMGMAEGHQIEAANVALAHGMSNVCGPAARASCVVIMESEK
nr:thiolase family protein [Desulfobacterales bacterium]